MVIGETQVFLIIVVLTALIGARRGWAREVITTAIVLATVVFLMNGGVALLGNVLGPLFGGGTASSTATTAQTTCSPINTNAISELAFVGMTWLGYSAGSKYGGAVKNHVHRFAGLVAGAVNGTAIAYYVSHAIFPSGSLLVYSPTDTMTASILPVILGGGLLALVLMLFVASQSSKSGGK